MGRFVTKSLPFLWMLVIYFGTMGMAELDIAPCCGIPRVMFEARHFLTHLASFALEAWLLSRAVELPGAPKFTRMAAGVVLAGLALGFGQETLQALLRGQLIVLDSLWDLAVDIGGSALGWWVYNLRPVAAPAR